jgi:tRNA (cmo5U34)-methyltransferase
MKEPDNKTPYKASDYDRNIRQTIPFYETIHQETIGLVRAVKPDAVCWLDTGCGTGRLLDVALPLFPNTEFILADPSEGMLQHAGERLQGKDRARVKMLSPVESEGLASQMAGAKCQVVTAIQCHHYLQPSPREQAVKACFDVLEDDGLFITFENIKPSTDRGIRIGLERWGRWQQEAGRSPSKVVDHLKRFDTEYFPITVDAHLALLKAVGFQTVELFWFSQMQAGFYGIK